MKLHNLGYSAEIENFRKDRDLLDFGIGRVLAQHRERYIISDGDQEYEGEVIGNLRFSARDSTDFPAVGDWVAISEYDDDKALIHAILPRKTIIERQAVGKHGEKQIIATNIDTAFIVQAVDRDFSINRIERYLILCYNAGIKPIIILSKTDLIPEAKLTGFENNIRSRIDEVPLYSISNETKKGIDLLENLMEKAKTYCLLGSSGVGKSTLLNNLSKNQKMKTGQISSTSNRGRHITSHRELVILDNGSLLIDNPGMREVGITDASGGLETTFEEIHKLADYCKFIDCTHQKETGCAVTNALSEGAIDRASYENYLKMTREKEYFESTIADRRKKDKAFGKMVKHMKNVKKDPG
jgi:ribosome biogenesis GTPase